MNKIELKEFIDIINELIIEDRKEFIQEMLEEKFRRKIAKIFFKRKINSIDAAEIFAELYFLILKKASKK